ncbi:MAG: hypothetical protein QNJ82_02175 [Gammaproteobacteria bacterium]|nr:hypothetical protein [Gammaproteobacteria bacterium]
MPKLLIPTSSPEDWKQFLAEPDKHRRRGYSARSLAYCWQEANGIPPEILVALGQVPSLQGMNTILAIPEHNVPLPGGSRPSQNDVWALGETENELVSIAVEGKVSEPFGPTVGEWFSEPSAGKEERLEFLCSELGLAFPPPEHVRYQLFHRTVSAILEAKRFRATDAAMIVHSVSHTNEWLEDYQAFLDLFGLQAGVDQAVSTRLPTGLPLHFAWVHGPERYLRA